MGLAHTERSIRPGFPLAPAPGLFPAADAIVLLENPQHASLAIDGEMPTSHDPGYVITGNNNRVMLADEFIWVKARQVRDFISYVKDADPNLLSTVFSWELMNETELSTAEGPFRHVTGEVVLGNTDSYSMVPPQNLSSTSEREDCLRDGVQRFCHKVADAIRLVDSEAQVSSSSAYPYFYYFNYDPLSVNNEFVINRSFDGLNYPDSVPRVNVRLSHLAETGPAGSGLDFFQFRAYAGAKIPADEITHERSVIRIFGMPGFVGEFEAKRDLDVPTYIDNITKHTTYLSGLGYNGGAYWAWDWDHTEDEFPLYQGKRLKMYEPTFELGW